MTTLEITKSEYELWVLNWNDMKLYYTPKGTDESSTYWAYKARFDNDICLAIPCDFLEENGYSAFSYDDMNEGEIVEALGNDAELTIVIELEKVC